MEEEQREAMFNGWKNSKTWLNPKKETDSEKSTVSVDYDGQTYTETFYQKDCIGSATPYNIAFNRLLSKMQQINKNIEIPY